MERNHVEELVAAAKQRDPEALAKLCEEFHPEVYRYMLRRAPREEAEDLANEVCLRAVKALPSQQGFFPAWLYRRSRTIVSVGRAASSTGEIGCPAQPSVDGCSGRPDRGRTVLTTLYNTIVKGPLKHHE